MPYLPSLLPVTQHGARQQDSNPALLGDTRPGHRLKAAQQQQQQQQHGDLSCSTKPALTELVLKLVLRPVLAYGARQFFSPMSKNETKQSAMADP
eukprot:1142613-Pelagomonas_calceolata.AAC.2